jgi:dihydroxy-acid dehydratase
MNRKWRAGLNSGMKRAGVRALMKAGGLCDGDFDKPLIGVHNTYGEGGPGHIHLRTITEEVRAGIYQAGGIPIEFGGPSHCPAHNPDGNDVPQRDIIAMSVENFVELHLLDAVVGVSSCDKPNPAHWLAASRLRHLPVIMALGGPGITGWYKGERITASTALQAGIAYEQNPDQHSLADVLELENRACPGPGACGMCGTANTTGLLSEVLGLTLPGGGSAPATSAKRRWLSRQTGRRIVEMTYENYTAAKILTPESLENAIIFEHAVGGSSNAIFHILALAEDLGIGDLINMDRIEAWSKKIPCIANVMPSGKYGVTEFDEVGGVHALLNRVKDYLHQDVATVNGKTLRQNLQGFEATDEDIIRPLSRPIYDRGLVILRGNLAHSAVARYSVFPENLRKFEGPARVFDSQKAAQEGLQNHKICKGDAIVVKYEGPRGGPGMPDLLNFMYDLHGVDLAPHCPVITDGKFSGFATGPFICQLSPEAAVGGPLAIVEDNDGIEIDLSKGKLNVRLTSEEIHKRLARWNPPEPKVKSGYLTLWARLANSAAKGAGLPYHL